MSLEKFLETARFRRVPLSRTGVGHFEIEGSLNRCGTGAGGTNLRVFRVCGAELQLGDATPKFDALLAMDLAHVNAALPQKGVAPVNMIFGIDVFDEHAAIIDYGSASLFLRDE